MKKSYLVLGGMGFGICYLCRPLLPMLYFWGDGIEVEINLPAHIVPSVGGDYRSSACQTLTASDFSWINGRRGGDARLEKISDTQYRAKVYYKDFGPCSWQLKSLGWTLKYKDAGAVLTGATRASGGGNTIMIGGDAYFDQAERNSRLYSDSKVFIINQALVPYVLSKRHDNGHSFYMENKDNEIDTYYYNPYKYPNTAKIIYNVTVDETSLKGLNADQAYRLQQARLARERQEKQQREEAYRRKLREEMDADIRQFELEEARQLAAKKNAATTPP